MGQLKVGDALPPLTLTAHDGDAIPLDELGKPIVLFFYPRDGTPLCTKEACAFRDAYQDFADAGATVIGVSGDSQESHRRFSASHHLPFALVSDTDGRIRRAFGVPKSLGLLPGRVTYVADEQGLIRHIFSSQLDAQRHVTEASKILRSMNS